MVKVCLYNGKRKIETYAIRDDGSECTILLRSATQELGLQGQTESVALGTIHQGTRIEPGLSVSFSVSSTIHPRNGSESTEHLQQ